MTRSSHPAAVAGVHTVDDDAGAAVADLAAALAAEGDHTNSPHWLGRVRDSTRALPPELHRALRGLRRDSGPTGALLLRGLPVAAGADVPPTPSVSNSVQRTPTVSAAVLMLVAATLGEPIAYRAEKSGVLVQDVVPVPGSEDLQGNEGSVQLSFHIENAFHRHRPDFVLLMCLRADHAGVAGLRLACVRRAYPLLDDDTRAVLSRPDFVTAPPPSFTSGAETVPHPVLSGDPDDPDIVVDFAATRPLTPEGGVALLALQDALATTAETLLLRPGDLAVVDNRVTLHGRTAFRPRYDGADRWLQRAFSVCDLRRSRDHRPADGHVLVR